MKVTKDEDKYRQPRKGGYLQKTTASYQMDLAMKMHDSYNVIGLIISFGLFILALGILIFSK